MYFSVNSVPQDRGGIESGANPVGVAPVSLTPRCRAANTDPVGVSLLAIWPVSR